MSWIEIYTLPETGVIPEGVSLNNSMCERLLSLLNDGFQNDLPQFES